MDPKKCCTIKEAMLNLSTFNYNHHPSRVKMVAKFIQRGIRDRVKCQPKWEG